MVKNSPSEELLFSVIVITKNEEKNIERCLKSIKNVFKELDFSFEIILVDSNSTDLTIQRAIDLDIKELRVVNITQSTIYSAALGRNVGSNIAMGKYLLFLDGDMKLYKDFILEEFKLLREEECAGIIGIRDDIILDSNNNIIKSIENKYNITDLKITSHFGGSLLIKSKVFREMGGYKEYIYSFEEPELYIRLKSKGYKIYETPKKMIDHYDKPSKKIEKLKSLIFTKRGFGLGQVIRSSFFEKNMFYLFNHKPVAQLFVPLLMDSFSYLFLILSFINIKFLSGFIFLQLVCFIICILSFDIKKFVLSKFLLIPTIYGLFEKKKIKYSNQVVK
ncbi:hypothetical protein CSV79_08715 [Sporosarcina sp. P13]|uniref:glycosyltransferase n=1 Tax=Sporosarcina sp. P13 TaxID=2048263 RepID=UPI000C171D82|nr:glycosyltransferase [Sporosarcina sp. P13]PIC63992.1 hypothetical protein CSV79_08715 [Sporosarcina sp. P13]